MVLSIVLVAGTACANSAQDSPSNSSATSAVSSPVTQPPGTSLPTNQLDAATLPEGYPRQVVVAPDGKTLIITAQEGGCGKASAELKEQTPDRIKTVLIETTPASAQVCTMDVRYPKVTVTLADALGQRIVELSNEKRLS